jgi:hypothetical protein
LSVTSELSPTPLNATVVSLDDRRGCDFRAIRILAELAARVPPPQQIPAPAQLNSDLFQLKLIVRISPFVEREI